MKPIRKPRLSPIEQRKQQIAKQIDELRQRVATKTRRDFKTDQGYERWRKHWPERLAKLEAELSILNDPGEYDSLPTAVVAEELVSLLQWSAKKAKKVRSLSPPSGAPLRIGAVADEERSRPQFD